MEVNNNNNNNVIKSIILIGLIFIILGVCFFLFQKDDNLEKTYYATFIVDGVKYQEDVLIEDGYITNLPNPPQKEGYIFDYWEVNGERYEENTKITSDAILTAVFRKNEDTKAITINFVKDNGEEDITIEILKDSKITPIENPEKDGYEFIGWYFNNEKYDFDKKVTEDITLTAKWKVLTFTISFDSDGGNKINSQEVKYGEKVTSPNTPTRGGHKFLGWYFNNQKYDFDNEVTKEITLIAKWEKLSFTINFDSNGGNKVSSQEVKYGDKVKAPNAPTKDGYKFLGWYLNNQKYDFNNTITKEITLIAKWEKVEVNEKIVYGDVNEDGAIEARDSLKIAKYLEMGETLTAQAKKNADVNADGKITNVDAILIAQYVSGLYKNTLPTSPIKDYILYGDVNEDGVADINDALKISGYLAGKETLTTQGKKNADANNDGKINNTDMLLVLQFDSGWHENTLPTSPIKDYVLYGDVNEDGLIEARDALKIAKHLEMGETLTAQAKKNADVNADGKITNVDAILIAQYVSGLYKDTLPASPIKDYILYGDVNEDGVADTKDALRISSYLGNNETLTTQGKKNADVNADGNVNNLDMLLIMQFVGGWYENTLPTSPIKNYVIYGDVNEDGASDINDVLKISNYLAGNETLTTQGKKNADVNADGNVNNLDMLLIMQFNSGWHENTLPASPIKDYVLYGDVYEDGIIDTRDSMQLQKYLNNTTSLSTQSIKNSDVNKDGKVNKVDLILLDRYLADWYENTLPASPIKDYVLYGDVNEDGLVDGKDSARFQKHLNGTEILGTQGKKNADVNNDGAVNDTDYQLLLKYLVEVEDGSVSDNPLK